MSSTLEQGTARLDPGRIAPWLGEHLDWREVGFVDALSGGNSNLTWRFQSADGQGCVVRTFPGETISPKAHRGIEREAAVLRIVEGHVRAPKVLAWCEDNEVIGRPFLVQEWVDGVALTDTLPPAYRGGADDVNALGRDLIAQLAAIHNIPWPSPALKAIGKPEKFVHRQLTRWLGIREKQQVRELPSLFRLGQWLLDNEPTETAPALIHGDYHLDNTLADREQPRILAVIDWELATVGDPYMDVALALMLWGDERRADPPAFQRLQAISRQAGVVSRRELAAHWSELTGRPLQNMDYYMALAFWRLAAIIEGAYCLYAEGKVDSDYARGLEYDVPALLLEAEKASMGDW